MMSTDTKFKVTDFIYFEHKQFGEITECFRFFFQKVNFSSEPPAREMILQFFFFQNKNGKSKHCLRFTDVLRRAVTLSGTPQNTNSTLLVLLPKYLQVPVCLQHENHRQGLRLLRRPNIHCPLAPSLIPYIGKHRTFH